jgi:NOL1/NOP2/fmu family ribosome biogenesis protein
MVQKTLEDIYEKSFELLESKIKEQSVEIENLLTHLKTTKEQISLRDTELSRYKTEIEVILIISNSARNLSDY